MPAFDPNQANEVVDVQGLKEFRAALKAYPRQATTLLNRELRATARLVADEANRNAPRGDPDEDPHAGLLAKSAKATTLRGHPAIRVAPRFKGKPVDDAAVHEWGGDIQPRGPRSKPIHISRSRYVGRAIHDQLEPALDRLQSGLDTLAARLGWR